MQQLEAGKIRATQNTVRKVIRLSDFRTWTFQSCRFQDRAYQRHLKDRALLERMQGESRRLCRC